jgi:ribonuclease E
MTDNTSKPQDDHWQRLAAELGLPFDEPAQPSAPRPAAAPAPAEPEEPRPPRAERTVVDAQEPIETPRHAPVQEAVQAEVPASARPEPDDADEEGRGRRRGRRRRGRGKGERRFAEERTTEPALEEGKLAFGEEATGEADIEPSAAKGDDDEEPEGPDGEDRRKRRRRRRRRRPDEEPAEEASKPASSAPDDLEELEEVDIERDEPLPVAHADDDDEPEEDFSDWNVPSWNELIASLYRPDR